MDKELEVRKELSNELAMVNLVPQEVLKKDIKEIEEKNLPIIELSRLGTAFKPLASAISNFTKESGGSGLYYVNTNGKKMFKDKKTGNFIGSLKNAKGQVAYKQAQMTSLPCDPTMLFVAVALLGMNKKLDSIHNQNEEILNEFIFEKQSKIIGNIKTLEEISKQYQFNWNNNQWIDANYKEVQSIKRESNQLIVQYEKELDSLFGKNKAIKIINDIKQNSTKLINTLKDYRSALYVYAYATFIDILLLGNFDSNLLKEQNNNIIEYSKKYQLISQNIQLYINNNLENTIEHKGLKLIGNLNKAAGKAAEKVNILKKIGIDNAANVLGDNILSLDNKMIQNELNKLIVDNDSLVDKFVDNINLIDNYYSNNFVLYFNKNNLYLDSNK